MLLAPMFQSVLSDYGSYKERLGYFIRSVNTMLVTLAQYCLSSYFVHVEIFVQPSVFLTC